MPIWSTLPIAATLAGTLLTAGAVSADAFTTHAADRPVAMHDGAHGPRHGKRAKKRLARMCKIAECTDAQRAKLRSIFEKGKEDTKAERQRLRNLHEKMRAELQKNTLDRRAILSLHDEIAKTKAALGRKRLERKLDALAVLTPKQRKRLAEHRKAHRKHDEHHHADKPGKGGKARGKHGKRR